MGNLLDSLQEVCFGKGEIPRKGLLKVSNLVYRGEHYGDTNT
jgi:hypothetical protein